MFRKNSDQLAQILEIYYGLSFRLFGNILADELVVSVLTLLVPLIVPLPVMVLGLFASSIQALIFSTLSAAYIGEAMEGH